MIKEESILTQLNKFRKCPDEFIDKKVKKKKYQKDYQNFLKNSPKNLSIFQKSQELFDLANKEAKNYSEMEEYNEYQMNEDFMLELGVNFSKKNSALIAIYLDEKDNLENLIPNIIVNESDKDKKGRNILTNSEYTHIGIGIYELNDDEGIYVVLIFSKIISNLNQRKDDIVKKDIDDKFKVNLPKISPENKNENSKNKVLDNKEKGKNEDLLNNKIKFKQKDEIYVDLETAKGNNPNDSKNESSLKKGIPKNNKNKINNERFFIVSINDKEEIKEIAIIKKPENERIKFDKEIKKINNFTIIYFKISLQQNTKFKLTIVTNNYKYLYKEVEVKNDNLLEPIVFGEIYENNIKYFIEQHLELLQLFDVDKKLIIQLLQKISYKKIQFINLEDLIYILDKFYEFNCLPFFLKNFKDLKNIKIEELKNVSLPKTIHNTISQIESSNKKEDKDTKKNMKNIALKIYAKYYYLFPKNKIEELNNDDLFIQGIFMLIEDKKMKFKNLISKNLIPIKEIIHYLIQKSKNEKDIENIFGDLNLTASLKSLVDYYELINKKCSELNFQEFVGFFNYKRKIIKIKLPEISQTDDIEEIFDYIKTYLNLSRQDEEKNCINIDVINLIDKIKQFYDKNLGYLIKLKKNIKSLNIDKYNYKYDFYQINYAIHILICNKLKTNKNVSNTEIIRLINEDEFYDKNLIENFDIHAPNKSGFADFIKLKNKKGFYEFFIKKIENLNDITIIFELFPGKKEDEFINKILDRLKVISDDISYINDEQILLENMYIIYSNLKKNRLDKFSNVIENINYFKHDNLIQKIYLYILKKCDDNIHEKYIKLFSLFSQFFIKNIQHKNYKEFFDIIMQFQSVNLSEKLLNEKKIIEKFLYKEEDIYSEEISPPNFELYKLFVENNFINNDSYLYTLYFDEISKLNSKIFLNMKDLKISFLKISNLVKKHKEKIFLSKMEIIFINEENKPDELFKNICVKFEECTNKIKKLENLEDYLICFEQKKEEQLINQIQEIIRNLKNRNIKQILEESETNKIENLDLLYEKSKNLRFKNSMIFMKIYEQLKEDNKEYDEIELFQNTQSLFNKIVNKIINYKNENFMNIENIGIILNMLKKSMIKKRRDEFEKEMEFISKEFNEKLKEKKESINDVKNNLINFSYLEEIRTYINSILWLLNIFKNLINNPNYQETEFTKNLSMLSDNLSKDNIKCEDVEKSSMLLLEYEINYKNKNDFNKFILKLYGKEDEITFCIGKKDEEIKNLNEYLQDKQSESGNLQPGDFDDFIGVKKYVNDIKESQIASDKELFTFLRQKFNENENFILKCFNYLGKYGEIKELYEYSLSDSCEITKEIIQKIMKDSTIKITKELNCFNFILVYENNIIQLKDIKELKNKSLLIKNKIKGDKKYRVQISKFKKIVNNLIKLCGIFNEFISSGYPSDIKIEMKIENDVLNQKAILKEYKSKYEEFRSMCNEVYIEKPYLRFLYGQLFFHAKIYKESIVLLKYISNGLIKQIPKTPFLPDEPNEFFGNINNYINEAFELNGLNLEKIFEKNKIINEECGLRKLAIYKNAETEKILLSLYKQYTKNYPLPNTVLVCNEYTSIEQIRAFLYLSFKCECKIMFCLLCLEKSDSNKIIKELDSFNKKYGKEMISCLTIIYFDNSEIKYMLSQIKPEIKMIELDNININEIKYENNDIEVWTSEKVGYGKSEKIKEEIEKEGKKYIYFPIGGDFSMEGIIRRLIDLNIPKTDIGNSAFHLDFSETNLIDLLKEVLLKILILKKLDFNEEIFYFDNISIKIELPNGFYNYMDKFPIFSLFKNIHIQNLGPLKIPNNKCFIKDSPIFIVANFLKKYKEGQIGKENINIESKNELTQEECNEIIDEYIDKNNNFNYYQKIAWINSLEVAFKKILENPIINPAEDNENIIYNFRNQIIKSKLKIQVYIIKGPYDNLISSQSISQTNSGDFNEEKENEQAIESLEKIKDNITYDNIPESLSMFNDDKQTFTIIPIQGKETDENKKFVELYRKLSLDKSYELPDFSNRDNSFYLERLKELLNLGEKPFSEEKINNLNQKLKEMGVELTSDIYSPEIEKDRQLYMQKLAKLNGNYIYTRDNFIKTVLIYERIQASLPVILMGETGCGKTSLLKMLSIFMNKGLSRMKTLNIHAGITEEDIITFMKEKVFPELNYEKELNQIMENFDKNNIGNKYNREKFQHEQVDKLIDRKIWVFFDELNTCNSMGLIAEMMCKRTMLGEILPKNIVFLGAINPYIKKTKKMKQCALIYNNDKSFKSNSLVYTVNPLPHTLMNFVFNFNSLNQTEEREYIKSMIQQNYNIHYPNKEDEDYKKLIELTPNIICDCHQFMRDKYGVASVSLREIRRFNIFFDFFSDYLKNKSIYKENYQQTYNLLLATLNMTIYLCYYLRIAEKDIRKEFNDKISQYFPDTKFLKIPNKEVKYISEQFIFNVDEGIALNNSLKESLFTAFVCVVNKIPLIIVGKPGGGKSLTIQALNNIMKGVYSESPLIKQYPQLFIYKYQGSITSTSKGVIETFHKAKTYAQNQSKRVKKEAQKSKNEYIFKEKYISLVFFDEMGLAEKSPNNPLKAIHAELEYDENEFKTSFIGISNWNIDASKMNRCLILSINDLDKEDTLSTSEMIAKSIENSLTNKYKSLLYDLALSYYLYIESVQNDESKKNFHGRRDFYHLIKCFMRELKKNKEKLEDINENEDILLLDIAVKSLIRNFGGLNDSIDKIISEFKNIYNNFNDNYYRYNVLECIEDNIKDYNSRFLMLVANSNIIKYLENVISSHNKKYIFLTGNKLKIKNEGYIEDLLNKIQIYMNQDNVLILQNLEEIYPSLYELFNQNYIKIGDKSFSKIAFSSSKTSSEVHKELRIILLISQEKLDEMKVEPPLLNRFEKQIISFNDVISEKQRNIADNISNFLNLIKTFNKREEELAYNLPKLLINCTEDEIKGMIYKISKENKDKVDDKEFIENELLKIIVPTFCQDIIASIKYLGSNFEEKYYNLAEKVIEIYKQRNICNFQQFLANIKKNKNIIYTFSYYNESLFQEDTNIKYKIINIDSNISENKLEDIISESVDNNYEFLLIKFNEENLDKIEYISHLVNNYEANNENLDKDNQIIIKNAKIDKLKIIFIAYLSRKNTKINIEEKTYKNPEFISNLDDSYDKIFIDNLKSGRNDFLKILDIKEPKELVLSIVDFDTFLDNNLYKILSYFDYKFMNKFSNINLNRYIDKIMKKLNSDKENKTVKFIRNLLIEGTKKNIKKIDIDFISKAFTSISFRRIDIDFFQILETYISSELKINLLYIVYLLEEKGVFSSLFYKDNDYEIIQNENIKNYIKALIDVDNIKSKKLISIIRANEIKLITDLFIPGSYNLFTKMIKEFIKVQNIDKAYMENERKLRKKLNNIDEQENEYDSEYDKLKGKAIDKLSVNDYNLFEQNEQNEQNIIALLFKDYLIIYCIEITGHFPKEAEFAENPIKLIDLLLQLKFYILFDDEDYENDKLCKDSFLETQKGFDISKFSEIFLFLESYKSDIVYYIKIYCLLSSKITNLFTKIKKIIDSKKIITEISDRNPEYKKRVNEAFFFLNEALIRAIFQIFQSIDEINNLDNYTLFFDSLKWIESTLNKINQKFLLYSNELYYLRHVLSIYNIFIYDKEVKDIMKEVMSIILELENIDNNNNEEEYQTKNLEYIKKLNELISKKYGKNSEELSDYMINFLIEQYKRAKDEDMNYKKKIIEITFKNEKLIQKSLFFIEQTFKEITFNKKDKKMDDKEHKDFQKKNEVKKSVLYFLNTMKNHNILSFYEQLKSESFNHVLLYHFELKANNYFNSIKNKYKDDENNNTKLSVKKYTELILGQNFENLKEALIHLDNIEEKKNLKEDDLNNIGRIYSIAYIKLYMKHFADVFINNNDKIKLDEIFSFLNNVNNNSRKVVKIFLLKNIFINFENYSKFEFYIMKHEKLSKIYLDIYSESNKSEKKEKVINNNNYILNYQFIPEKILEEKYFKSMLQFDKLKQYNFQNLDSLINKDINLDVLLCLLTNNLISYFYIRDDEKANAIKSIEMFKNEFDKISNILNAPQITIKLLDKFLSINEFLKDNKKEFNSQQQFEIFEIIVHSFRYVLQSSLQNKNNFYYNLLTPQCKEYVSNNFIIGALPYNDIHIITYNKLKELLDTEEKIEDPKTKETKMERFGIYICTCGQLYIIQNCTRPVVKAKCGNKKCDREIGGLNNKPVGSEEGQTNALRVCRNDYDKDISKEINIQQITFEEYKKKYVDNLLPNKGMKKEELDISDFTGRHRKIRKIEELPFRILNFILYSHLLFSNLIGNLSEEDLKSFIPESYTCMEMIEKNWELISKILQEKGVYEIKIFMNIIFFQISQLLYKIEDLSTNEKREEFEIEIQNCINQLINNKELYLSKEKEYSELNQNLKKGDSNSLVEIILENYSPFENLYSEKDYPNLGMFLLSKYPNNNDLRTSLEKEENYGQKYFLLNQLLINYKEYYNITNVININELVNILLRKYNNNIDREKAKSLKISECLNECKINKEKSKIPKNFIESWKKIKSYCRQYSCKPEMPELEITEENLDELTLNYFLPDDGELGGGMYLASAYSYFINLQNEFINNMMMTSDINSPIRAYSYQLNQEIKVQEATEEDLIDLKIIDKLLNEFILIYSMRDIFKDGKINYKGFNMPVNYNFMAIENELVGILLPGVKKFVSDDEKGEPIKFVTYLYEAFRGKRSSIITNYNDKYPSRDLTTNEKEYLIEFLENENNIIEILSSCQILIDFIQNENYNKKKSIYSVIKNMPKYIELNSNLIEFFERIGDKIIEPNNNQKAFSVDTLINIYNLIEYKCWNQFKNNLNEQYKQPINEENKRKIQNRINDIIKENSLIKKQDLADAIRRLISRYLGGKREDTDINENQKLMDYISRADLWKPSISGDNNFENELSNIFNQIQSDIKIICHQNNIKCELCEHQINVINIKNPCSECKRCRGDLLIGQSLEFFEIINEDNNNEIYEDKITNKNKHDKNEIIENNIDSENEDEDEEQDLFLSNI